MAELPDEVIKFIGRYLTTVESLQVLLLLQQAPERHWTAREVASEHRLALPAVDKHLARLCSANLLDVRVGADLFYRFRPRPSHLEQGARALAACYAERPQAVIRCIQAGRAE